jgi:hypothetical protein
MAMKREYWWPPEFDPSKHSPPPHPDFWSPVGRRDQYSGEDSWEAYAKRDAEMYKKYQNKPWRGGEAEYQQMLNKWRADNNISSKDVETAAGQSDQLDWKQRAAGYQKWAQEQLTGLEQKTAPYLQQEQELLAQFKRRAAGQDSLVELQAAAEKEQLERALQSQVASAPGRYDPTLAGQGIRQRAGLGVQMAPKIAAAKAAEEMDAEQQYQQALAQQKQWQVGMEGMRQQLMGFGRGTEMGMEEMAFRQQQLEAQKQMHQSALAQRYAMLQEQKRQADRGFWSKIAMGGLSAAGGLMGMFAGGPAGAAAGSALGGMAGQAAGGGPWSGQGWQQTGQFTPVGSRWTKAPWGGG